MTADAEGFEPTSPLMNVMNAATVRHRLQPLGAPVRHHECQHAPSVSTHRRRGGGTAIVEVTTEDTAETPGTMILIRRKSSYFGDANGNGGLPSAGMDISKRLRM